MGSNFIDDHLEHLRALGRSPRTIAAREHVLRRLHDDLPLGIAWAETSQLERWLADLVRAGRAAWTLATYAMHLRGFYRWADGRVLEGDPMAGLDKPRHPHSLPNPVTDDELGQSLERSGTDDWWHVAILFATLAGLRASEVAGLRREHVLPDRILITLAKGGDPETVPVHPQLVGIAAARPSGPLIHDRRGRPIDGHALSARARHHFDQLGLPDVRLHRFRHRFATDLLRQGVDIRVVQELMRHRSIRSTQGYTLVVDAQRTAAISRLPYI